MRVKPEMRGKAAGLPYESRFDATAADMPDGRKFLQKKGAGMMRKRIPIGIEFYKEMMDKDYYYVDKTLLMKEILDSGIKVGLFTRPRRFGKTLTLSMLKTFFEDERDPRGARVDNRPYFEGKKIAACVGDYMEKQGQYPVISLTLKSAKQPDFEMAYHVLRDSIMEEFERHRYILQGDVLTEEQKARFHAIYGGKADSADYATALLFLSKCLQKYHNKNVVILIDEYDVPLENAYFEGFYDRMLSFVRSLFESALKTNTALEFAVVTGCLRISRESIFTGLNNLEVVSILNHNYSEFFGFTLPEVQGMLAYYGLAEKEQELKEWYDGYRFGNTEIYNPWSVINYVKAAVTDIHAFPKPYWSNTSSNSIIRELVEGADFETRMELERLIGGGTIEKLVHEDITYGDIHESQDNLWNFLFFTGYLKKVGERFGDDRIYLQMAIPNWEIRHIYRETILSWLDKKIKTIDLSVFLRALEAGDCAAVGDFLSEQLQDSISFYDYAENYYHGFLPGLLKGTGKYRLLSNRESGSGRPDIVMQAPSVRGKAFIFELKVAKEFQQMEARCREALEQAAREDYRAEMERIGYSDITVYGVCFYRKECLVEKG